MQLSPEFLPRNSTHAPCPVLGEPSADLLGPRFFNAGIRLLQCLQKKSRELCPIAFGEPRRLFVQLTNRVRHTLILTPNPKLRFRAPSVRLTYHAFSCERPSRANGRAARRLRPIIEMQSAAAVTPCKMRCRRRFSAGPANGRSSAATRSWAALI